MPPTSSFDTYQQDITACWHEGGLTQKDLAPFFQKIDPVHEKIRKGHDLSIQALLDSFKADIPAMRLFAEDIMQNKTTLVVLGMGGASLSAQCLVNIIPSHQCHHQNPAEVAPKIYFPDNLDANSFARLLHKLPLQTTRFLVVSKSGQSLDTLAQYLLATEAVKKNFTKKGSALKDSFAVITQKKPSPLYKIACQENLPWMACHPNVDGRFSAATPMGLVAPLCAGFDAESFCQGINTALNTLVHCREAKSSPAVVGAALHRAFFHHKAVTTTALLGYDERLSPFLYWYRQLWAESLCKNGQGTLPDIFLGPRDQHSQLQMYLDGPYDKLFTFLVLNDTTSNNAFTRMRNPVGGEPGLQLLEGKTAWDIVRLNEKFVSQALIKKRHPVRVLLLNDITPFIMGSLMAHFMMETIYTAALIPCNPFGQPGVDLLKNQVHHKLKTAPRENVL